MGSHWKEPPHHQFLSPSVSTPRPTLCLGSQSELSKHKLGHGKALAITFKGSPAPDTNSMALARAQEPHLLSLLFF